MYGPDLGKQLGLGEANLRLLGFYDLGRTSRVKPLAGETLANGFASAGVGLRYGKGNMHRKNYKNQLVYWQGPSIGFDIGGNASKCFTLVYQIRRQSEIYQRFPGVEGSAYNRWLWY